jgi:hypothetical protein
MLELLADITTHPIVAKNMKDRYEEFYSQIRQEPNQPLPNPPAPPVYLKTRMDFYAVEIKSKVICTYFKYFLKDELCI